MTDKQKEIENIKKQANSPKHRLMELENELREIGAIRKANSLNVIIGKLESWQNR